MAAAISAFDSVRASRFQRRGRATNRRTASDSRSVSVAGLLRPVFAGTSGSTTSTLAGNAQRLSTGHETFEPLPAAMSSHRRRRADDLFEVVQDQQQLPLVQSIDEALGG